MWAVRLRLVLLVAALALIGSGAPDAGGATPHRVVLVTFECDGNFLCPGFASALRRTGLTGRIISPDRREDRVGTLSLLARQGYDLVIVDATWGDALGVVAPRFPGTRFAILDAPLGDIRGRPPNVEAVVVEPRDAAYLAGWLAARVEQLRPAPHVLGAVGGLSIKPVNDLIDGFRAGARSAVPGITVLTQYSHDFTDPTACAAIARSQIARGAGVVFNVAGACGLGTLRAAKEAGAWGVGVDTDQSFLGDHILTSVVKRYGAAYLALFRQVQRGSVQTGRTTVLTLRSGGAGLGRISPRVPAALRAGLERVRQRLLARAGS